MTYGFLNVGNGIINAFSSLTNKVNGNESFQRLLNLFAYSIDVIFLIGIILAIIGVILSAIQFVAVNSFKDDEDKHREAKGRLKKALIGTGIVICIPILVTIIGFIVASSGALG